MGWVSTLISQRKFRIWGIAAILVVTMAALAGGIASARRPPATTPTAQVFKPCLVARSRSTPTRTCRSTTSDCIDWLTGNATRDSARVPTGSSTRRERLRGRVLRRRHQGGHRYSDHRERLDPAEQERPQGVRLLRGADLAGTDGTSWAVLVARAGPVGHDEHGLRAEPEVLRRWGARPTAPPTASPRSTGNGRALADKLITYDLSRGGTQATISVRNWTGSAWGPANPIASQTAALGTINSTTITTSPLSLSHASSHLRRGGGNVRRAVR